MAPFFRLNFAPRRARLDEGVHKSTRNIISQFECSYMMNEATQIAKVRSHKQNRHHRHPVVPLIALSTPRSASSVDLGAMYVTVQKSIRHKSSRMYHGVYSGRRRRRRRSENNDSTSEGERAEERGSEEASKAFISVALFYFFVRSTLSSTFGAFPTE